MDNIKGYRELTAPEVALMNKIKEHAAAVGQLVDELSLTHVGWAIDQRWVSIGATDLQTGFMALVRAVAQPTSF